MKRCPFCRAPNPSGSQDCYHCKASISDVPDIDEPTPDDDLTLEPGFWSAHPRAHALNLLLFAAIIGTSLVFWHRLPTAYAVPAARMIHIGTAYDYWLQGPLIASLALAAGYGLALLCYGIGRRVHDVDSFHQLPNGLISCVGVTLCLLAPFQYWIYLDAYGRAPSPWIVMVFGVMNVAVYLWIVQKDTSSAEEA